MNISEFFDYSGSTYEKKQFLKFLEESKIQFLFDFCEKYQLTQELLYSDITIQFEFVIWNEDKLKISAREMAQDIMFSCKKLHIYHNEFRKSDFKYHPKHGYKYDDIIIMNNNSKTQLEKKNSECDLAIIEKPRYYRKICTFTIFELIELMMFINGYRAEPTNEEKIKFEEQFYRIKVPKKNYDRRTFHEKVLPLRKLCDFQNFRIVILKPEQITFLCCIKKIKLGKFLKRYIFSLIYLDA